MKKVKVLSFVLIALNIVIVTGCALTHKLVMSEVIANGSYNIEPTLCLWLEGCLAAIAIASFVISLIILGRIWSDTTDGGILLITCNMVISMAVVSVIGACFWTDLTDASFYEFKMMQYETISMIGCLVISLIATLLSIATAILLSKDKLKKH